MIGVFDSGVGGLTVVKEIFKNLPEYQIIYFGDTARLPYGTKGADFVRKASSEVTSWLLKKGAKIIVVACHTSSAWASESLKKEYKDVPIFEMISPTIKGSLLNSEKIGVIGTPGTIKSNAWKNKLSGLKVFSKACPLFVPLVEEGWIDKNITKEIVKEYLSDLRGIDILILACTHYPILKKIIKEVLKDVKIIDPAESLVKELALFLENNPRIASQIKKGDNHQFFFSDEPYNFKKISKLCLGREINARIL